MADQELADLTNLPTPATSDLLYVVADPGGTPVDRKATIAAVLALAAPGGGGPTILDTSRPNITVTNTATETDVYTLAIPGGTLGTTGIVAAVLLGKKVKNGGGSDGGMRLRVYYGGTLVGTLKPATVDADSASGLSLKLEVDLLANGAADAQIVHARVSAPLNASGTGATVATSYGTAAEDSTAAKTLRVTWQQAAVPDHSFTSEFAKVTAE